MNKITPLLASLSAAIALSVSAHAQMISIPNYNLQPNTSLYGSDPVIDTSQHDDVIQYFTETATGPGHYGDAGVQAPDGTTSAFINTDNNGTITLTSDLTAGGTQTAPTFVAGDLYTLTLQVGINPTNTNTDYDRTGNVTFGLLAGNSAVGIQTVVAAGEIVPTLSDTGSPEVTFDTFTYTYLATAADAGKTIGIQINDEYPAASQTEFSDLTLTAPEPSVWAMSLVGLVALVAASRFRRLARL